MRLLLTSLAGLVLASSTFAFAADGQAPSQIELLKTFLKEHVDGVVFRHERDDLLQGGRVKTHYKVETVYGNVRVVGADVTLDTYASIEQTMQDLDADGNPVGPVRHDDRRNTSRYHFTQMQSTGRLLGRYEWLSGTSGFSEATNEGISATIEAGGPLVMTFRDAYYQDYYAAAGGYYPGTADMTLTFSVEDGKLKSTTRSQAFRVDPDTLARTPMSGVRTVENREAARLTVGR